MLMLKTFPDKDNLILLLKAPPILQPSFYVCVLLWRATPIPSNHQGSEVWMQTTNFLCYLFLAMDARCRKDTRTGPDKDINQVFFAGPKPVCSILLFCHIRLSDFIPFSAPMTLS